MTQEQVKEKIILLQDLYLVRCGAKFESYFINAYLESNNTRHIKSFTHCTDAEWLRRCIQYISEQDNLSYNKGWWADMMGALEFLYQRVKFNGTGD